MLNVHERLINAPADVVGALLDRLAGPDDPLWPAPAWAPMLFDRPLGVGAAGGHDVIRYTVEEYEPGRRVRLRFAPEVGIAGFHELSIEPQGGQTLIRHVIDGPTRGKMLLFWPLAVRWMHDAVIEDLFDNAEWHATGHVIRPSRWPFYVRALHRLSWPKPRLVPLPESATLIRSTMEHPDLQDSWQINLPGGMPTSPDLWAEALFRRPPGWILALMRLRNKLVGLIGVERADDSAFDALARNDSEHLLGTDAGHLDFRASILVASDSVVLSTVAKVHNGRGRLYLAVIKLVHPAIVRGMLRHTSRRLALDTLRSAKERV